MINLQKGQRETVTIPKFTVGLGWDANSSSTGYDFDLDASAFMLGENGKIPADEFFVFYNNLKSPDQAVVHTGDNLTGEGEGDDESIRVDLAKVDPRVNEIIFVVTIHESENRRQNFGQVRNAFIRIYDENTGEEIMRYDLDEDFSIETAVEFGRLYKRGGQWKFEAIGTGQRYGLAEYLKKYN
jgi:tellurium resistance protein TerD